MHCVVTAHRKSTSQAARKTLNNASLGVSVTGMVIGVILILFLRAVFYVGHADCGVVEEFDRNDTVYEREPRTTAPEVTPSACYVVGNESICFRYASAVTRERCLALDGVMINVTSSLSSSSSSSAAAAAAVASTMCYHNVCTDYTFKTSCFQHRSDRRHRNLMSNLFFALKYFKIKLLKTYFTYSFIIFL